MKITHKQADERILIINASVRLSSDIGTSSDNFEPLPKDRGDVRLLYDYLRRFLFRPVDLAGCILENYEGQSLIELLKEMPHRRVIVMLDETDNVGIDFTRTTQYLCDALKADVASKKRQIVVVPATQSLTAIQCSETTFTLGAAYQRLSQDDLSPDIYVGSCNTIGHAGSSYYTRNDRKITTLDDLQKLPLTIHFATMGGTIDGFAGVRLAPPGNTSRVAAFAKQLVGAHYIKYKAQSISFKDGRNIDGNDIRKLNQYLADIWKAYQEKPTATEKPCAIGSAGTFALENLGRVIGPNAVRMALLGAWRSLDAADLSDGGFNIGQAAAYLAYDKTPTPDLITPMIIANGLCIPAPFAEKDGGVIVKGESKETYSLIFDRRMGAKGTVDPYNRPRIVFDPHTPR